MKPTTSPAGRHLLARIRKIRPFLEGSLTITTKRCGNPNCRCAAQGPIHPTAVLTWKEDKKTRTLYVPRALRSEVAQWIEQAKLLKQLIRDMSEVQRKFLIAKRGER